MTKLIYRGLQILFNGSNLINTADDMANNFLTILENAIESDFVSIAMSTLKAIAIALVIIALTIKLLDNIRMDQVTEDIIIAYFLKIAVCMAVISLTPEIMKLLVELIVGIYSKISNIAFNNSIINLSASDGGNIYVFLSKTKETNQMVRKFSGVWGCEYLLKAHYTKAIFGFDMPTGPALIMILITILTLIINIILYLGLGFALLSPIIIVLIRLFFLPVVIVQYASDNAQAMLKYFRKILSSGLTCAVVLIAIIVADSFSSALVIKSGKGDYRASDFESDIDTVLNTEYSEDGSDLEDWAWEYIPAALNYAQASGDTWLEDYEVKVSILGQETSIEDKKYNTISKKVKYLSEYVTSYDFGKRKDLSEFNGTLFNADNSILNNYLNHIKDELSSIDDNAVIITTKNIDDITSDAGNLAMFLLSKMAFIAIMLGVGKLANDIFGAE